MLKILVTGTILAMQLRCGDAFVPGGTCPGLAGCPSLRSSCRPTSSVRGVRMAAEGFEVRGPIPSWESRERKEREREKRERKRERSKRNGVT
jgi:hypothetical protein